MDFNSKPNIQKILKRCSKGNKKAQEHLYRMYYGYAMGVALRYSKSHIEAEEICNDSFYKVFTKTAQYDNVLNFKAWFRKILINTAIDNYRSNEKNNQLVLIAEHEDSLSPQVDINTISAEEIIELLHNLTPMYRMVFNLYIIEGYNHDEIATKLNITPSTSRSNLTRAKQKLRELIKDYNLYEKAR